MVNLTTANIDGKTGSQKAVNTQQEYLDSCEEKIHAAMRLQLDSTK